MQEKTLEKRALRHNTKIKTEVTSMMKRFFLGVLTVALMTVFAMEMPTAVLAQEKEVRDSGVTAYSDGTFVGYCSNCADGDIYLSITVEEYTEPPVACQHGYVNAYDIRTIYVYRYDYRCDKCSYAWSEPDKLYVHVECKGSN